MCVAVEFFLVVYHIILKKLGRNWTFYAQYLCTLYRTNAHTCVSTSHIVGHNRMSSWLSDSKEHVRMFLLEHHDPMHTIVVHKNKHNKKKKQIKREDKTTKNGLRLKTMAPKIQACKPYRQTNSTLLWFIHICIRYYYLCGMTLSSIETEP